MQQIADWLEKLGLAEYTRRFAENDIDFTILGDLTDQELEKIGVASLGDRRKLLRAIADLEASEKRPRPPLRHLPHRHPKTPPSAARSRWCFPI
jgi:hypothetical protein